MDAATPETPGQPPEHPGDGSVAELFRDSHLQWSRVSSRLTTERRIPVAGIALIGLVLVAVALVWAPSPADLALGAVGAVLLLASAVSWVVVGRIVATWAYAERDQDLLVTRGRTYRRLSVIPYGRMQVIEVSANPVSGWLGIATVTLVTASSSTDARIPGLVVDEAHALRDRLAAKGEAMTAGL